MGFVFLAYRLGLFTIINDWFDNVTNNRKIIVESRKRKASYLKKLFKQNKMNNEV